MSKASKITLWTICGVVAALLIALCVLLCLGFRFTPEATVGEYYRDNVHISTDEYDFYLNSMADNSDEENGYSDGHQAVKKYGFLYKRVEEDVTDYKMRNPLVAENGESVGTLYSYKGKNETYHFIHWFTSATAGETNVKYRSKTITINEQDVNLYLHCYFSTSEQIETLVVKDTNVFIVNGLKKGNYWNDEKVKIINTESDIDAEQLKAHYENGGIIVVRAWQLANDVETIVRGTNASEHDEKDLATVFCKSKSGAPYTGVVQGNTSDLESEIDEMVARAKSEQ